jgi:hypothetical protein
MAASTVDTALCHATWAAANPLCGHTFMAHACTLALQMLCMFSTLHHNSVGFPLACTAHGLDLTLAFVSTSDIGTTMCAPAGQLCVDVDASG